MKFRYTQSMKHPISLFLSASKFLGEDIKSWITWDSVVIQKELSLKMSISKEDFNKIMAIKTLYVTDAPWDEWEVFLTLVQTLNGLPINLDFIYLTDNPLPYLYNAVEIMNLVRKQDFNEEISRFCAAIFLHENVQYVPEPLQFCQIYVSQPKYHCKNCGKIGPALPPFNFVCEDCGKVYDIEEKDNHFNFQPTELNKDTTNIELTLEYPIAEIRKRYEESKAKFDRGEEVIIEETELDVQVGKLLLAKEFTDLQSEILAREIKTI